MGAYLVLFPHVRIWTIIPLGFYFTSVALPAWLMIVYWAVLQVVGFIAGVATVKLFVNSDHIADHRAHHWRPVHVGWR